MSRNGNESESNEELAKLRRHQTTAFEMISKALAIDEQFDGTGSETSAIYLFIAYIVNLMLN